MIKFCPNCGGTLSNSDKLSQGCKICNNCKGVYYILETTVPKPLTITTKLEYAENKKQSI